MFATQTQIQTLLQLVRGKIRQLPLNKDRKELLLEDINLAIVSFDSGNVLAVLNSIEVIVDKIHTQLKPCNNINFRPLLADLHIIQQMLIEISLPSAAPSPPGSPGEPGPPGEPGEDLCPRTGNLIVNGDFESGNLLDPTSLGEEWHPFNSSRVDSPLFSGDWSARLGDTSDDHASIYQEATVRGSCPYHLDFAAQLIPESGPITGELLLVISFLRNDESLPLGIFARNLTTPPGQYSHFSYLLNFGAEIPIDTTRAVIVFTKIGSGTAYIDMVNFGVQ